MKQIFLTTVAILFANLLFGQVPQAFNYQGAARTASGTPIANATIAIRASVLDGSAIGTVVYSERNVTTTSGSGIFSIGVGNGTPLSGSFASINWSTGNKFLKIDLDATGGTNYVTMGTTQFLSVPYAQYAASAGQSVSSTMTVTGIMPQLIDEFGVLVSDGSGIKIDLQGSSPLISSITDVNGYFSLKGVPSGTYNLVASKAGYTSNTNLGVSFVTGGLKAVDINPGIGLQSISTTLPQGLTITTGTSATQIGYRTIRATGSITPAGTAAQPRVLAFYYSTTPGIDGTINGTYLPALSGGSAADGSSGRITSSNFDFSMQILYNLPVPAGNAVYFKAFGKTFNELVNFNNGSNEVSIIVPAPYQTYAFSSFSLSTVAGYPSVNGFNQVKLSLAVTPQPTSAVPLKFYLSTSPIPSDLTSFPALGNPPIEFFSTDSQGNFNQSNSVNDFVMRGYVPNTLYYLRGYTQNIDGSTNFLNPSSEVRFVMPSVNNPGGLSPGSSGAPCGVAGDCLSNNCNGGTCR